jgi:hypothetical protein
MRDVYFSLSSYSAVLNTKGGHTTPGNKLEKKLLFVSLRIATSTVFFPKRLC